MTSLSLPFCLLLAVMDICGSSLASQPGFNQQDKD
jgi:hypothetical protein